MDVIMQAYGNTILTQTSISVRGGGLWQNVMKTIQNNSSSFDIS